MYVIAKLRDFYNEGTRIDLVTGEDQFMAETFESRDEAEKKEKELNRKVKSGDYYLAHNEYGRAHYVTRHVSRVKKVIKNRYINLENIKYSIA